jgi:hypothetical protein
VDAPNLSSRRIPAPAAVLVLVVLIAAVGAAAGVVFGAAALTVVVAASVEVDVGLVVDVEEEGTVTEAVLVTGVEADSAVEVVEASEAAMTLDRREVEVVIGL